MLKSCSAPSTISPLPWYPKSRRLSRWRAPFRPPSPPKLASCWSRCAQSVRPSARWRSRCFPNCRRNNRMLGALRFQVSQSRGRRYPELDHPYRNPFQRDRDRVIHARAFRRLEAKTQVFTPGLSDHFRNRLTHTIEVSQIARTVASVLGLDEDLTEALALIHDIGHPPFAHAAKRS